MLSDAGMQRNVLSLSMHLVCVLADNNEKKDQERALACNNNARQKKVRVVVRV